MAGEWAGFFGIAGLLLAFSVAVVLFYWIRKIKKIQRDIPLEFKNPSLPIQPMVTRPLEQKMIEVPKSEQLPPEQPPTKIIRQEETPPLGYPPQEYTPPQQFYQQRYPPQYYPQPMWRQPQYYPQQYQHRQPEELKPSEDEKPKPTGKPKPKPKRGEDSPPFNYPVVPDYHWTPSRGPDNDGQRR